MSANPDKMRAKRINTIRQVTKPSLAEIQRRIQEGLDDLSLGRIDGPHPDAASFLRALHADVRERPKGPKG